MIALLLALALAGDPPPDLDLGDLQGYADRARAVLDGPIGCWEVQGYAVWALWKQDGPRADYEGPFVARLVNGAWRGLPATAAYRPLVGEAPGGKREVKTLAAWLESLVGEVDTEYLAWDRDRDVVVLTRHAALVKGDEAEARVFFRDEGPVLDAIFPRQRLSSGTVLLGAGYTVRTAMQEQVVLPAEETLVVRMRSGGKEVRTHQTVEYRQWRRCGSTGR